MQENLKALVELAAIDGSVRDVDLELAEIPKRMEVMRSDLRRLEEMLSKERSDLEGAKALQTAHGEEIASRQEQLSRSRIKSNQSKNAREADAADHEMQVIRKAIKDKEDEQVTLAAAIEKVTGSLSAHEKEFETCKVTINKELEEAQARLDALTEKRASAVSGRDASASRVDKTMLHRYNTMYKRFGNAVVPVVNGTCEGCRMQVPAQQLNVILRGKTVEQCRHCMRILYVPEQAEAAQTN